MNQESMKRLQKYLRHLKDCALRNTPPQACSCGLSPLFGELFGSLDEREHRRVAALMRDPAAIFVFGSNLAGRHGAGAAKAALDLYGAEYGVGEGLRGRSYALPTKDHNIETLPLPVVAVHVHDFLEFAWANKARKFVVTRIGCGLAGFTAAQIAPLFNSVPPNCFLPEGW